jgi:uracil-DNA glycosylase
VLLLNPTLTIEIGRIGSHLDCGWQALTSQIVQMLCRRDDPPVFLLWGDKAQRFFEQALPAGAAPRVFRTRHPSNDMQRRFMAEGSHFRQTADLVDWWAL